MHMCHRSSMNSSIWESLHCVRAIFKDVVNLLRFLTEGKVSKLKINSMLHRIVSNTDNNTGGVEWDVKETGIFCKWKKKHFPISLLAEDGLLSFRITQ